MYHLVESKAVLRQTPSNVMLDGTAVRHCLAGSPSPRRWPSRPAATSSRRSRAPPSAAVVNPWQALYNNTTSTALLRHTSDDKHESSHRRSTWCSAACAEAAAAASCAHRRPVAETPSSQQDSDACAAAAAAPQELTTPPGWHRQASPPPQAGSIISIQEPCTACASSSLREPLLLTTQPSLVLALLATAGEQCTPHSNSTAAATSPPASPPPPNAAATTVPALALKSKASLVSRVPCLVLVLLGASVAPCTPQLRPPRLLPPSSYVSAATGAKPRVASGGSVSSVFQPRDAPAVSAPTAAKSPNSTSSPSRGNPSPIGTDTSFVLSPSITYLPPRPSITSVLPVRDGRASGADSLSREPRVAVGWLLHPHLY